METKPSDKCPICRTKNPPKDFPLHQAGSIWKCVNPSCDYETASLESADETYQDRLGTSKN